MPSESPSPAEQQVKKRILEILKAMSFDAAVRDAEFRGLVEQDARSNTPMFAKDSLTAFDEARKLRDAKRDNARTGAFFSNKSVLIVPGFMGSQLTDRDPAGRGLIWIDPSIVIGDRASQVADLRLAKFRSGEPDRDAKPGADVREDGAVPVLYAGLRYYLESGRCEVRTAAFDWRKDIDESAELLVRSIQAFSNEFPRRDFFLIAHSQGSLVARRALQLLGKDTARRIVNRLILLGPASLGTFSAAFALAGNHSMIPALARYGVRWPADLNDVLQSMSGLYQLLPWKLDSIDMDPKELSFPAFWKSVGADADRLAKFWAWGAGLDTEFFNDRTTIILGDAPETPSAVEFQNGVLKAVKFAPGDGTVTDACAMIHGVVDVARAAGADHMTLPLKRHVMQAVWRSINANVNLHALRAAAPPGPPTKEPMTLPEPVDLLLLAGLRPETTVDKATSRAVAYQAPASAKKMPADFPAPPPTPPHRRLRVFSFDPLLATDPESLGMETIVLKLNWDDASSDGAKLKPGPVGEYLEVVDYDPVSKCFYAPVDLNHSNLLAQDGMPVSETDPRFHQQMVYAVGMATIAIFERALGRTVLWAPHLPRDARDRIIPNGGGRPDGEFVRRLRIYPHAMREANAYYDPDRKALLFGYFPAKAMAGGRTLPRGMVFTCLSYDVVAHEMTHALLDGMHRHLIRDSNPDVLAFHEAFADIVALFQHFSHPEVLRAQVEKVAGKLQNESLLGQLAQQFGEAMGMHKSLRNYLGETVEIKGVKTWVPLKPDPMLYATVKEPHDRGAILVAAVFTAFLTIYRSRTRDLMRIASGGSGLVPPGDLHPDLVRRLADEAAKTAKHLLIMAIRAIDYLPPVDVTFGDYLRALITGDVDLVPGDGRLYRVAVVDAFRQWGIYPTHVRNLSVESLVWGEPDGPSLKLDLERFRDISLIGNGNLKLDRSDIHQHTKRVRAELHEWMRRLFEGDPALGNEWGLAVGEDAPATIERDDRTRPEDAKYGWKIPRMPKFDVHSVRRCRRVGPDEQERVDVLVEVVQRRNGYFRPEDQVKADHGNPPAGDPDFVFRGGCTLVIDPRAGRIRYSIRKAILSADRLETNRAHQAGEGRALGLHANYFGKQSNPFPLLHATED